tara:strand:+ start:597 stop:1346 length:750 start_codon:yes stop_codon:yes gene_type:complete
MKSKELRGNKPCYIACLNFAQFLGKNEASVKNMIPKKALIDLKTRFQEINLTKTIPMDQSNITDIPSVYSKIQAKSKEIGFSMPSDLYIGSLLKTLISSRTNANILELGTGIGLSLAWMVDGLGKDGLLTTIDNNPELTDIAKDYFGTDPRLSILCEDGEKWIKGYSGPQFDLIFADSWPGKYSQIDEILSMVKVGGFYIIDDMNQQENWPIGHAEKAESLVKYLEKRDDFNLTKMNWSTGVILMTKIK